MDAAGLPLAVLTGHTYFFVGILETRDGKFLSWYGDGTLRLWDAAGQPLAVLEAHTGEVTGALETRDGQFLSWYVDGTLRLWDAAGQLLAVLTGHERKVTGALETHERRFLPGRHMTTPCACGMPPGSSWLSWQGMKKGLKVPWRRVMGGSSPGRGITPCAYGMPTVSRWPS